MSEHAKKTRLSSAVKKGAAGLAVTAMLVGLAPTTAAQAQGGTTRVGLLTVESFVNDAKQSGQAPVLDQDSDDGGTPAAPVDTVEKDDPANVPGAQPVADGDQKPAAETAKDPSRGVLVNTGIVADDGGFTDKGTAIVIGLGVFAAAGLALGKGAAVLRTRRASR